MGYPHIYCKHCQAKIHDAGPVARKHLKEAHGYNYEPHEDWARHYSNTKKNANIFDLYG